jgi:hypothetical protein
MNPSMATFNDPRRRGALAERRTQTLVSVRRTRAHGDAPMDRYAAKPHQTLTVHRPPASPCSWSNPHARVTRQFSTLPAAIALKSSSHHGAMVLPRSGARPAANISNSRSSAQEAASLGTPYGGVRLRHAVCPSLCDCMLSCGHFPLAATPALKVSQQQAIGLARSLPGGPPARDPTRGWSGAENGGHASALLTASRDFPIQNIWICC